jgi:hypothetical protein
MYVVLLGHAAYKIGKVAYGIAHAGVEQFIVRVLARAIIKNWVPRS